jgi:hypothetical protein
MKRLFGVFCFFLVLLFASETFAQARQQVFARIRDRTNTNWQANVTTFGLTFPTTRFGVYTVSGTYYLDDTGAFRSWLGAPMNADNIAQGTRAPWVGSFSYGFDDAANRWDRLAVRAAADNLAAGQVALEVLSYNLYYDGTQYRRLLGGDMADNLAAAQTVPWVGAYNLFYDGANHRRWLGAQMNADGIATTTVAPWAGVFNMGYDANGANWDRMTLRQAGDGLSATQMSLETLSYNLFYDGTNYRRWLGAQMNSDAVAATTYAPWTGSFGMLYQTDTSDWARRSGEAADGGTLAATIDSAYNFSLTYGWDGATWSPGSMVTTHADGLALTLNGLNIAAFLYGYNGATMDLLPTTAIGGLQVGIEAWHPAYDAGNGWINTFKDDINVYAPAATTATAVDDAAGGDLGDIVLASFYALNIPNITIYIDNAGGGSADALLHCYVLTSPSGAAGTWSNISTWNDCDGKTAAGGTCHLQVSGSSHAYLKAECICDTGDDTTVDATVVGNKG